MLVSPSAAHVHRRLSMRLAMALDAAEPAGFEALEAINVRLAAGRILIPDLAVITTPGVDVVVSDAEDVAPVIEILSPGSVVTDRAVKPQLYAVAGIESYLRVERGREGPTPVAYRLKGGRYIEEFRAEPGQVLPRDHADRQPGSPPDCLIRTAGLQGRDRRWPGFGPGHRRGFGRGAFDRFAGIG